jgi:hypothetical protein
MRSNTTAEVFDTGIRASHIQCGFDLEFAVQGLASVPRIRFDSAVFDSDKAVNGQPWWV